MALGHWQRYEVVLDVPKEATIGAFGVLLSGAGALWIDDVKLETVSLSVPVTSDKTSEMPEVSTSSRTEARRGFGGPLAACSLPSSAP